ncbi:MAG: hypothetical protein AMXMBFR64_56390 [Myxococcales bacterium]
MVMLPDQAFEDDLEKLHAEKSDGKLGAQRKQQAIDPRTIELLLDAANQGDSSRLAHHPEAIATLHGAMGNRAVSDLLAARGAKGQPGAADGQPDGDPTGSAADGLPDGTAKDPLVDAKPDPAAGPPAQTPEPEPAQPGSPLPAIGMAGLIDLAPRMAPKGAAKPRTPSPDKPGTDTESEVGKALKDLESKPDLKRVDPAGAMPHLPLGAPGQPGGAPAAPIDAQAPKPGDGVPQASPVLDPGAVPGPASGKPDAKPPVDGPAADVSPIADAKPTGPMIPGPDAMPQGPGPDAQPGPQPGVPGVDGPIVDQNEPGPLVPGPDAVGPDAQPKPDAGPDAGPDVDKAPGQPDQVPGQKPVNEGPSQDPAKKPDETNAKPKDEVKPAKDPDGTKKDPGKDPAKDPNGQLGPKGPQAAPDAGPTAPVQVAPVAPAQDPGPGGTLEEYMAAHPDPAAAERVEGLAGVNGSAERNATLLNANVPKPPDRSFLLTLGMDKDWANLQKNLKTNPFNGEGSALEFITKLNSILDFAKDVSGKIGMAATIGGAILTLLVPPVGAFLLTVGRVANAVSLVLSGLRVVTGILSAVMLAVRIAKEKDPVKRLEMAQMMRQECQAVVGSGLDLILSKLGGKAKGGGKVAGQKATDSMKAAWKEAKGVSKVTSSLKAGASTLKQNMGTGFRETVKGAKQNLTMVKKLGVGGTLKAGATGMKNGLKGAFVTPLKDLKGAVGDFKYVAKDFKDFRSLWKAEGYWRAVGKTNFPSLSGAGAKWSASGKSGVVEKAKLYGGELKRDMLDATAGGYATRIYAGMNGVTHDGATKKQLKQASVNNPTSMMDAKAKLQKMEEALAGSSRNKKITAVNGGDKGVLSDTLYEKGKKLDDAGLISASYRNRAGANLTDETLDATLKVKIAQARSELTLFDPKGALTGAVTTPLTGKGTALEGALTGGGKLTGAAGTLHAESRYSNGDPKPGFVNKEKAALKKQSSDEMTSYVQKLQEESQQGVTAARVDSALSAVAPLLDQRARDIEATMGAKGGDPGSSVPHDPPPPPPPEGTVVPSADLLPRIDGERARIKQIRAGVEADIKASTEMKAVAEQSLAEAQKAKASMGKAGQTLDGQTADAQKDSQDIAKAKAKNEEAQAKLKGGQATAEGEKGNAEAKANEGRGVKADPDKGKKDAEERKKAEADKREWDAKYSRAGWFERRKMDAKKLWASFTSFLARAADWVWKKLIQPAINAVKSALAKVMGFLTDMIMKGVMGIVKLFLSEEEKQRLDGTMVELKEQQAKQAELKIQESKAETAKQTTKATEAETKAQAEMARCDANIQQGQQIIAELDANDQALAGESTKVTGARDAFRAQYAPYFDWVARQGARKDEGQEEEQGAAFDPAVHPAERPLPPQVTGAIHGAADAVAEDSRKAEGEVAAKAMGTRDQIHAKAASFADEPAKKAALENGASDLAGQTVQTHGLTESERRSRLAGLKAQATAAGTLAGSEAITRIKALQVQLAEEAAGVDVARGKALTELRSGMMELVRHQG